MTPEERCNLNNSLIKSIDLANKLTDFFAAEDCTVGESLFAMAGFAAAVMLNSPQDAERTFGQFTAQVRRSMDEIIKSRKDETFQ